MRVAFPEKKSLYRSAGSTGSTSLTGSTGQVAFPEKDNLYRSVLAGILVITILLVGVSVSAQTVQGRLEHQGRAGVRIRGLPGAQPAAYVKVFLYDPKSGQRSPPVYTGSDGMYYFYHLPPGDYILEIWAYGKLLTQSIRVSDQPATTIPPIPIP